MAFPFHVCIAITCTAESGSRKSRSVALLLPLQSVDANLAVGESKLRLILKEIEDPASIFAQGGLNGT